MTQQTNARSQTLKFIPADGCPLSGHETPKLLGRNGDFFCVRYHQYTSIDWTYVHFTCSGGDWYNASSQAYVFKQLLISLIIRTINDQLNALANIRHIKCFHAQFQCTLPDGNSNKTPYKNTCRVKRDCNQLRPRSVDFFQNPTRRLHSQMALASMVTTNHLCMVR